MKRLSENKLILVVRKTRLDELVVRFNTIDQARFYIEHLGADFKDYLDEHTVYQRNVTIAKGALAQLGRVQVVDRALVPNFIFGPNEIVIALGQDGLVANVLKYLDGQPVLGVNPDPKRWDGVLLPFVVTDLPKIIPEVFAQKRPMKQVTMADAKLTDGSHLLAVNDLFIGPRSHVSARYTIAVGNKSEKQSSSGIIVSTGLGSTGWLQSIMTGASAIAGAISGRTLSIENNKRFSWDSPYLYFSVREPFPSRTTFTKIAFGKVTPDHPLSVTSHMAEEGVIFSDGVEKDFLRFNAGMTATITLANKRGLLVL